MKTIDIIPFSESNKAAIRELNYAWLEKYFSIEEHDRTSLSDPKKEILDKGGAIFYAQKKNTIVGVIALLKTHDTVFEVAKMAVDEEHQGEGIGHQLLLHAIDFARSAAIEKLYLYSNTKLKSAISLYKKLGFREIPITPNQHKRANIKMELHLEILDRKF